MSPTLDAVLRSWPFDPWLLAALVVCGVIYLRGLRAGVAKWRQGDKETRRQGEQEIPPHDLTISRSSQSRSRWHGGHVAAFLGGLAVIYLALASPIEPFSALLLQVHMVQHLLLMMVAPPLLWLGEPMFPMLWGLPRSVRVYWVTPLLASRPLRRFFGRLTHPLIALPIYIAATWLWHVPPIYDLALRSSDWHYAQHICFLGAALLFWYPVVRPYPSRPGWSLWFLVPYLFLADISNTVLSALFTFSGRVLYPYYAEVPRLAGISVLEDQNAAGVLMWVPGSIAFLLPLVGISFRVLYGPGGDKETGRQGDKETGRQGDEETGRQGDKETGRQGDKEPGASSRISLPVITATAASVSSSPCLLVSLSPCLPVSPGFDLLRLPLLGRFLKWRHARLAMQVPLLVLAGIVILDGLRGPQVGPMNLAGVLPWIHWRGFAVLGLLAAGNVFCMACPFMLPRTLARRWLPQGLSWPRWLRSKWLAVALLVVFLWAYEAFALWDSPWWTAWIAIGYFLAAFVIDGFFRGAAFCKYICPIGQFNFVQSLVAPFEVKVVDPNVCAECQTRDCIRGTDEIPGCELNLFQPRKAGNMDCTFCLDCIHACPHDNIGIVAQPPARELWRDSFRSGVGRFSKRSDVAALIVVLTFGAFVNAAGMVAPVLEWRDQIASTLGQRSPIVVTSLLYVFGLLVLPASMVGVAAILSRWLGRLQISLREVCTRFAYALVPLGFGMWLAHYSFHFLSSYDSAIPVLQRFAADLGLSVGEPAWRCSCCLPVAHWLPRLEIFFLDVALLLSLYTTYRVALTQSRRMSQALKVLAPWALLMVLLFAVGVWIVLQPMEMRGTLFAGG